MKMKLNQFQWLIAVPCLVFLGACASKEVRVESTQKKEPPKPVVEQIQDKLRSRNPAIAQCYEAHVDTKMKAGDKPKTAEVLTQFFIDGDGKVKSAKVTRSTLKNKRAEACILDVIKGTQFPQPESPAGMEITYPFEFTSEVPAAKLGA